MGLKEIISKLQECPNEGTIISIFIFSLWHVSHIFCVPHVLYFWKLETAPN